jgi:hypothetical protein
MNTISYSPQQKANIYEDHLIRILSLPLDLACRTLHAPLATPSLSNGAMMKKVRHCFHIRTPNSLKITDTWRSNIEIIFRNTKMQKFKQFFRNRVNKTNNEQGMEKQNLDAHSKTVDVAREKPSRRQLKPSNL